MIIVYVILHYNTYDMTIRCIESIENVNENAQIVVVDNCSPNESGRDLERRYSNNEKVHILLNPENAGFAKGNNVGYKYAKEIIGADIIVDINNDVTIEQIDFEQCIVRIVQQDDTIAVIAPKIINSIGKNQNPYRMQPLSLLKRFRYLLTYSLYYNGLKSNTLWKPTYLFLTRKNGVVGYSFEDNKYDIVPHGSCVIFTPSYVKKSNYAFLPITFFYGEEDILFDYVKFLNLRTFYSPAISINHWEKSATKTVSGNARTRALFQTRNRIQSIFAGIRFNITSNCIISSKIV